MFTSPALLLLAAGGAVGVLHTIVPDHWVPIALIARQRHWTTAETARAAGLTVDIVAVEHTVDGLVAALTKGLAAGGVSRR